MSLLASNIPTPAPAISVIVVNWRQPALTARALRSLRAQESPAAIELVLVENEAKPGSADALVAEFPELVVVRHTRNEGFAGGVNAGIAASSGPVVALVNNDAVVVPGFVAAGLRRLSEEGAAVAAVAARIELEGRFRPSAAGARFTAPDGTRWAESDESGVRLLNGTGVGLTADASGFDRDWLRPLREPSGIASAAERGRDDDPFGFSGGGVFLRREALERVGGLDARFFMYYEDVDLSWRLRLAGYRVVYEPEAIVVHRHGGSSSSSSELMRRHGVRNRALTVAKNASAGLAFRVGARTVARAALDAGFALARRPGGFLRIRSWLWVGEGLVRGLPAILAERRRARATPTPEERRDLERAFLGR